MEEEEQHDGTGARLPRRFGAPPSSPPPYPLPQRQNTDKRKKISFGVAPALVAFSLGLRTPLDNLLLAFFILCGLTRLARFNVTASSIPKDATGKARYFEGTPIPTTLGLDALMAWWLSQGWIGESLPGGVWFAGSVLEVHPVAVLFVVHGCLMTSRTIHIPKP